MRLLICEYLISVNYDPLTLTLTSTWVILICDPEKYGRDSAAYDPDESHIQYISERYAWLEPHYFFVFSAINLLIRSV